MIWPLFLIFIPNNIPIQSPKNFWSHELTRHRHASLASFLKNLHYLLFTLFIHQPRKEQKKASSHQVGKKDFSRTSHRCNNGLWLHCESHPKNAFSGKVFQKVQIGRRMHHLEHTEVYAVYDEYVWDTQKGWSPQFVDDSSVQRQDWVSQPARIRIFFKKKIDTVIERKKNE